MKLTKDERMLAVLYGDGTRIGQINALKKMRMVLQENEQELRQMTEGFLLKLENMTDDEFREAAKG